MKRSRDGDRIQPASANEPAPAIARVQPTQTNGLIVAHMPDSLANIVESYIWPKHPTSGRSVGLAGHFELSTRADAHDVLLGAIDAGHWPIIEHAIGRPGHMKTAIYVAYAFKHGQRAISEQLHRATWDVWDNGTDTFDVSPIYDGNDDFDALSAFRTFTRTIEDAITDERARRAAALPPIPTFEPRPTLTNLHIRVHLPTHLATGIEEYLASWHDDDRTIARGGHYELCMSAYDPYKVLLGAIDGNHPWIVALCMLAPLTVARKRAIVRYACRTLNPHDVIIRFLIAMWPIAAYEDDFAKACQFGDTKVMRAYAPYLGPMCKRCNIAKVEHSE